MEAGPGPEHPSAPIFASPAPPLSSPPPPHAASLPPPPSLSPSCQGPHLPREAGPLRVRDVILSQVPVQPVAEVEEAVIQRQQDVGDQACGGRVVRRLSALPRPRLTATFNSHCPLGTHLAFQAASSPSLFWGAPGSPSPPTKCLPAPGLGGRGELSGLEVRADLGLPRARCLQRGCGYSASLPLGSSSDLGPQRQRPRLPRRHLPSTCTVPNTEAHSVFLNE